TSASRPPPGTGTSSTWSGCSCSSASTGGAPARRRSRSTDARAYLPRLTGEVPPKGAEGEGHRTGINRFQCHPVPRSPLWLSPSDPAGHLPRKTGEGSTWEHLMPEWPRQSPVDIALRGACPRCGRGRLFGGVLRVVDRCSVCDLDLRGNDAGDGP